MVSRNTAFGEMLLHMQGNLGKIMQNISTQINTVSDLCITNLL